MADTEALKRFHVEKGQDGFRLHVEDEAGNAIAVMATHEQMDVIADRLDELLDADEAAEAVEGEG